MADAVTPSNFAVTLLGKLGLPTTQDWQYAVQAWVNAEGGWNPSNSVGARNNNPLNATCSWPGQIGCTYGGKVGVYGSLDAAATSYATGLLKPFSSSYNAITHATTPAEFVRAVTVSQWAGSNYGGVNDPDSPVQIYKKISGDGTVPATPLPDVSGSGSKGESKPTEGPPSPIDILGAIGSFLSNPAGAAAQFLGGGGGNAAAGVPAHDHHPL